MTTVLLPQNGPRSGDQQDAFTALTNDLKNRNITLSFEFSEQLHDRQIMYVINLTSSLPSLTKLNNARF